jgi:hypothetical protein
MAAQVGLAPGQKRKSELYDAIPHRHTNRNPYQLKTLPSDFVEGIRQLAWEEADVKVFVFTSDEDRSHIVDMISKANDIVYADPQVEQGSQRWIRREWSDVQKFRDGLILDEFGQPPLTTAIIKFTPPWCLRFAFRHKLLRGMSYTDLPHATPLFRVIAVHDRYDREQSLRVGRVWQRAHLLATARHLAGRPVNEAVELIDHQRFRNQEPQAMAELSELIRGKEWQPTFMFRFGYPVRQVSRSPRRPLNDVLL